MQEWSVYSLFFFAILIAIGAGWLWYIIMRDCGWFLVKGYEWVWLLGGC